MPLTTHLKWRYATKKFDATKKVSQEHIDYIQEAVQLSASSYGLQPFKVLVAAQRDDITPIEAERELAGMFSDAELVEIADVGHLIHYEAPAEAAGAIRRFLRIPVAPAR